MKRNKIEENARREGGRGSDWMILIAISIETFISHTYVTTKYTQVKH